MKITVVTTIYRTAGCIQEFYKRASAAADALAADLELIFVNDGTPDNGLIIAEELTRRDPRVVVVDLARNFGQHRALLAGMEFATGDVVAILDGDLDDDPAWLVEFHRVLNERGCDVVFGIQQETTRSILYRAGRGLFYFALNALSAVKFPRNVITARLMTRRYVDAVLEFGERELFLVGLLHMAGFDQVGVHVSRPSHRLTTYTLGRLLRLFLFSVTSFSVRPLLAISLLGLALSGIAALYIAVLLSRTILYGSGVPGWASVMAALMLFSGITLFFNGIIAIYIATIFLEVKKRPRVIIREVTRGGHPSVPSRLGKS